MYDTTCLVVRVGGVKGKVAVPAAAAGQHQPHHDHHQQDHCRVTCGPFEKDAQVRISITVIYLYSATGSAEIFHCDIKSTTNLSVHHHFLSLSSRINYHNNVKFHPTGFFRNFQEDATKKIRPVSSDFFQLHYNFSCPVLCPTKHRNVALSYEDVSREKICSTAGP